MRFHRGYAFAALVLFIIEAGIALFVRDRFVRPVLGDVLAVMLVYCGLLAVVRISRSAAALAAFAFAVLIECLQYLQVLDIIGLQDNRLAQVILGTTFSWGDIVAYAVGAVLVYAIDARLHA